MKKIIYKLLLGILPLFCQLQMTAQQTVTFKITDLDNSALKLKIEKNITQLLTEINFAQAESRVPTFIKCDMEKRAQSAIFSLWENTPFKCAENNVTQKCLKSVDGYQVRNIILTMVPEDSTLFGDDCYQEAVINFNANGQITNFQMALSNNLYQQVFLASKTVEDMRRRQIILDYVEQFRTAYNTKDMDFLEQIFSEDALIITGKVIKRIKIEKGIGLNTPKIEYSVQSKQQYLGKLSTIFKNNRRIRVVFDDIKVYRHGTRENIYGVVLKQGYTSDSYSDIGYLFLLWDFQHESGPKIHVRTWQPDKLDANTPLPEDEIFNIYNFNYE